VIETDIHKQKNKMNNSVFNKSSTLF